MEVIIEDKRLKNLKLGDTTATDWMLDNALDVVQMEIDCRFQLDLKATSTVPAIGEQTISCRPLGQFIPIQANSKMLYTFIPGGFAEFDEGDLVTVTGSTVGNNSTKTIIEKIDNQTLIMDTIYVVEEQLPVN